MTISFSISLFSVVLPSTSHLLHILNSSLIFDIYSCSVSVSPTNGEFTVATSVAAYCKQVMHAQYFNISVGILSYPVTLGENQSHTHDMYA